jgi:hypothetical protein
MEEVEGYGGNIVKLWKRSKALETAGRSGDPRIWRNGLEGSGWKRSSNSSEGESKL